MTKMTRIQKFPNFQRFYAIVIFSINIVDKNVENVQQGTNSLPNRILFGDKCDFLKEKLPQEWQNYKIFSIFNVFMQFLSNFR